MSRASRKSELSPSVTRSRGGIDLGKNSGGDVVGGKASPSITSGGIGVSTEVANIGGVSVTGGVSVDISPIDLGINYDPAENSLGIAGGAEIPGGLLGVSGGVTIDLNTGEVTGGSIGGEALGIGVGVSVSKNGIGVSVSVQIPFTPIEVELGFGFPSQKEPTPGTIPSPQPFKPNPLPSNGGNTQCTAIVAIERAEWNRNDKDQEFVYTYFHAFGGVNISNEGFLYLVAGDNPPVTPYWRYLEGRGVSYFSYAGLYGASGPEKLVYENINLSTQGFYNGNDLQLVANGSSLVYSDCPLTATPTPIPNPFSRSSPFPNPPPRKRNMDDCCRESIQLQRLIVRHLGAERTAGNEILPDGVRGIGSQQEGIRQAYPFTVKKCWVDPNAKENENISILNDRQLALVIGGMLERLEKVLGTSEFYKDSDKKLRQSEGNMLSWLTGKNKDFNYPDPNDFWLNADDGIINEKMLEVRSIADGLRYQIEALNRLERILPIAELKDSSIPKRWIFPGATGQERVGNLIHLIELMVRSDDKHRGYWPVKVKVKDADPAIKGDQPINLEFHSQADVFRELFQYLIDTEGDGDLTSNFALRSAFQTCQMHQLTVQNHAMLDAIVEYLDFKINKVKTNVPMPFNPFAGISSNIADNILAAMGFIDGVPMTPQINSNKEEDIEALAPNVLQNTIVEVDIVECVEQKTLNEALLELLKHSSAASAAVSERVSETAIDRVIAGAGLAQKVTSFLLRKDVASGLGIGDLDKWINSAELGYTDSPEAQSLRFPESDPQQPYNRPSTENPQIREIDTKDPKAD